MLRTVEVSRERHTDKFQVRVPKSIGAQIKETASRQNTSSADVIRRIIEAHMQQPVRVRPFRPRKEET